MGALPKTERLNTANPFKPYLGNGSNEIGAFTWLTIVYFAIFCAIIIGFWALLVNSINQRFGDAPSVIYGASSASSLDASLLDTGEGIRINDDQGLYFAPGQVAADSAFTNPNAMGVAIEMTQMPLWTPQPTPTLTFASAPAPIKSDWSPRRLPDRTGVLKPPRLIWVMSSTPPPTSQPIARLEWYQSGNYCMTTTCNDPLDGWCPCHE
jgi:hypothetical protein